MNTPASLPLDAAADRSIVNGPAPTVRSPYLWRRLTWAVLAVLATFGLAAGAYLAWRFDPLEQARTAVDERDYRRALKSAQDYLRKRPEDPAASLLLARSLSRLGQGGQAEEYFKRSAPLGLADSHDRAYGLVLAGKPEQAAEIYFDMIKRWPDDVLALKRLAGVLMELKAWKPALLVSERLIRIPEGEVAGQTLAGIGFHVARHAAQAVSSFERILQLDPDLKEMPLPRRLFWNHLALDLIALGRTAEARGYLKRALAEEEDAYLRELLGVTHEKEGSPGAAEKCWRQALAMDPRNADTLLDLGRLDLGRGRFDEAVELLTRAVEASPNSVDPVYNLSRAYRLKGDLAKARNYERRAQEPRRAQPPRGGMGEMPETNDLGKNATVARQESAR
jgi:tetratricopeptide (TPR) repeat protein